MRRITTCAPHRIENYLDNLVKDNDMGGLALRTRKIKVNEVF
jgi:hypothetical protein